MDFLNVALTQIRELFGSMSAGARITSALLLATIVVSVAYLFNSHVSSPDQYLLGGAPFTSSQLGSAQAAFGKAGLEGAVVEGNRIRVPRGKENAFTAALADAGALPPDFGDILNRAVTSGSPFENEKSRRARMKVALENSLSLIVSEMPGIEKASVLYAIEQVKGLSPRDHVTASVNVKPQGSEPLSARRSAAIRNLVATAIPGLKPTGVNVTDLVSGQMFPGGDDEDGASDASRDPYLSRKERVEQDLQKQIIRLLGIRGAAVVVSAELNPETTNQLKSVDYDPKVVNVRIDTKSTLTETESGGPGGRPGPAAQGPGAGAAVVGTSRGNVSRTEKADKSASGLVSQESRVVETIGLTPKDIKVSVRIPSNYYLKVWNEQNRDAQGGAPAQPPEANELNQIEEGTKQTIRNMIATLLPPVPPGAERLPRVTVTTLQSLTPPSIEEPTLASNAMAWANQYWTTLGMIGVAIFSLLMLRSMVKSMPAPEQSPMSAPPSLSLHTPEEEEEEVETITGPRLKRRSMSGPNLKDDLTEIVREDPDAAASILRNWLSSAG